MRGKRSKQYRKLMQQYGLSFGFREPYQVLLDADIIRDADRFKMDLVGGLERTLHGQVKPMITQCSMRHLYKAAAEAGVSYLIDKAKTYERRRCGHRPEDYPEPLSTRDCLASVVDPKDNKSNKNCYVIASQELEVRKHMRGILGVPLKSRVLEINLWGGEFGGRLPNSKDKPWISSTEKYTDKMNSYINRSVMIMEPMAGATAENREKEERVKFRAGLKRGSGNLKRKREDDVDGEGGVKGESKDGDQEDVPKKKKKFAKGPKGPNPLAVKKSKKKTEGEGGAAAPQKETKKEIQEVSSSAGPEASEGGSKRPRKRKPRAPANGGGSVIQLEVAHEDK